MRILPAMIEIDDIKDRESLRAWFNTLPQRTEEDWAEASRIAVGIAWRAAARVVPEFWHWTKTDKEARKRQLSALPILRQILISSVAAVRPTGEIVKGVLAGVHAANATATATAKVASDTAKGVKASNAAFAGANAGGAAASYGNNSNSAANAAFVAADAVARAASIVGARFWHSLREDIADLDKGKRLDAAPLWSSGGNHLDAWNAVTKLVGEADNHKEAETDWSFWIWWYEGLLNGTAPAPDSRMVKDIALLPDEVWQDTVTANARINEIWRSARGDGSAIERVGGEQEAEASMQNGTVHIQKTIEQLQLHFSQLKSEMAQLKSDLSEINAASKRMSSQISRDSNVAISELGESLGEMKAAVEVSKQEGLAWLPDAQSQLEDALAASKAAFESEAIFERPVRLWQQKFRRHSQASKEAYTQFLCGLGSSAVLVLALLGALIFASEFVSAALSPSWCDPKTFVEGCNGFSLKGGLVTAGILVLFTLLLWFTRLKMKEYLAERHLALDAQERQAFASSYVRLLQSNDGSGDEVKEQRAIVYGALFRPSSSGFVKDEGGLDPSVAAAISKLLAK